jgi:hypothetical protein
MNRRLVGLGGIISTLISIYQSSKWILNKSKIFITNSYLIYFFVHNFTNM